MHSQTRPRPHIQWKQHISPNFFFVEMVLHDIYIWVWIRKDGMLLYSYVAHNMYYSSVHKYKWNEEVERKIERK